MMSNFRNSLAAVGILALMLGASSAAHATSVTSFDDVGLGNLSGTKAGTVIDNQSAGLTVKLKETGGLVTTDLVAETLNNHSFTLTPHGDVTGSTGSFAAGFTFNLVTPSFIKYTPTPGSAPQTFEWVAGIPTVSSSGVVTTGKVLGVDTLDFASLPAGKYTLLFTGVVNLAAGASTSFGGTISAVPLPGSLVMFGSALLGLTAFGARRRRTGLSA